MGDLKFILGFIAGWIATTEEGKQAANKVAATAVEIAKKTVDKTAENKTLN